MGIKRINCIKCRHFYVTWDAKYPKGCRAFGFKTNQLPSLAVFRSSGAPCLKFEEKNSGIIDKVVPYRSLFFRT